MVVGNLGATTLLKISLSQQLLIVPKSLEMNVVSEDSSHRSRKLVVPILPKSFGAVTVVGSSRQKWPCHSWGTTVHDRFGRARVTSDLEFLEKLVNPPPPFSREPFSVLMVFGLLFF